VISGFQLLSALPPGDPKMRVLLRGTSPVAVDAAAELDADGALDAAAEPAADGAEDVSELAHAVTSRPKIASPASVLANPDERAGRSRDLLERVCNSVSSLRPLTGSPTRRNPLPGASRDRTLRP
jgi:hypothetical protein